jgi:hypothetical protein
MEPFAAMKVLLRTSLSVSFARAAIKAGTAFLRLGRFVGIARLHRFPWPKAMPAPPAAITRTGPARGAPTVNGESGHTQAPDSPLRGDYVCFFSIPRRLQTLQHCR